MLSPPAHVTHFLALDTETSRSSGLFRHRGLANITDSRVSCVIDTRFLRHINTLYPSVTPVGCSRVMRYTHIIFEIQC